MHLLVLNGSLGGSSGNTSVLLREFVSLFSMGPVQVEVIHLSERKPTRDDLARADAFCFATGTYWDSWGSPLQRFFEEATVWEGDSCWFGKPACAIVTMHSVGGKEVLNRLQGVLNTFGLYVPPMSALAYSLAGDLALRSGSSDHADDFWSRADLEVLAANIQTAASQKTNWARWPVDKDDPKRIWLTPVST